MSVLSRKPLRIGRLQLFPTGARVLLRWYSGGSDSNDAGETDANDESLSVKLAKPQGRQFVRRMKSEAPRLISRPLTEPEEILGKQLMEAAEGVAEAVSEDESQRRKTKEDLLGRLLKQEKQTFESSRPPVSDLIQDMLSGMKFSRKARTDGRRTRSGAAARKIDQG